MTHRYTCVCVGTRVEKIADTLSRRRTVDGQTRALLAVVDAWLGVDPTFRACIHEALREARSLMPPDLWRIVDDRLVLAALAEGD
jgi:predicted nuclease with RNAse H fold